MKKKKICQGCSLFYAADTGEMGNALFAVGGILLLVTIFTVLGFAHLSKPEPLDKSRKSLCCSYLQNRIIYRESEIYI